jgi:putative hydrolase of the HAD superfamily
LSIAPPPRCAARHAGGDAAGIIRAVLFDFDGVLTTDPSGSYSTVAQLARSTGLDRERLWAAFAPFNDDLLHGRTTHAAVWPAICERLGRELPFTLLHDAFDATPMNAGMLALAARLRATHAVGIVTDNKRDRMDRLVARHALDALFDPIVVSADCGSGKSTPAIFRRTLDLLGVGAEEAVFVDNTPRNLVAARALGMHALHFDDARNDVGELAATLRARFGLPAAAADACGTLQAGGCRTLA